MNDTSPPSRLSPPIALDVDAPVRAPGDAIGDVIVDVSLETFMSEVIDASQERPVLLDFWAPWCEPCKQLSPILEKIVGESNGALKLARMDIDAHPAVAQQMQVQSIPAVFLFVGGQPIDGFVGVLPESEIKKFLEQHLSNALPPAPAAQMAEQLLAQAQSALAAGDAQQAGAFFQQLLQSDGESAPALAGLAECHIALGDIENAAAILSQAHADSTDVDIVRARASLALAEKTQNISEGGGDVAAALARLHDALAQDANNHQARFDLALAYHANGAREEALDALLQLIARQKNWNEDAARQQLLQFFEAYGTGDELVVAARRRLSSLLFA